jgi:hypothetical protein
VHLLGTGGNGTKLLAQLKIDLDGKVIKLLPLQLFY